VRMGGCERDRRLAAPASEGVDDSTDAAAANSMASGAFLLALVSSARHRAAQWPRPFNLVCVQC
jgi:hypothetical protein